MLRARVLAEHEAIFEPLRRDVAEYLVVVLVARRHQPDGVARTWLQLPAQVRVAHVLVEAELRVLHDEAAYVVEIGRRCRRVHLLPVEMHPDLEIGEREDRHRELSGTAVALRRGHDRPWTLLRIRHLRRVPGGMQHRVHVAVGAKEGRAESVFFASLRSHLIGVEQLARHLALKPDVMAEARRDHELGPHKPSVGGIFPAWRSDEIAVRRKRKIELAAAARGKIVEPRLDCGGVVGHSVAPGAKVAHAQPSLGGLVAKHSRRRARRNDGGAQRMNQFLHMRIVPQSAFIAAASPGQTTLPARQVR